MTNTTAGLPTASQIKPNGHIAYVEAEGFTTFEDQDILQSAPVTVASPASQTHNPVIRSAFKIFGMLCLACSIAEMGIGSFAYQYIKGAGAFWSVIMGVIAGLSAFFAISNRGIMIVSIVSMIGYPIAAYGCFLEYTVLNDIKSLTACGRVSLEPGDDGNKFFGEEKYRLEVAECMRHTKYSSSESRLSSCSCVNSAGHCAAFKLNTNAVSTKNCGDVIDGFPSLLLVSVVFSAVSGLFLFALAISGTCTVYYRKRPHDVGLIPTHPSLHEDVTTHHQASHAVPIDVLDESFIATVRAPEDPGVPLVVHVLAVHRTVESMSPVRYRSL